MSFPTRRLGAALALAAFGAVLIALALGFGGYAAFLALSTILPPWRAALAVFGAALLFGVLALWAAAVHAQKFSRETEAAIKSHILTRAAPLAFKFALSRPKIFASLLAALAALGALLRAFQGDDKT